MPSSSNAALNVFVWLCIALFSSLQHFQLTIAQESGGRVGLGGECVKQNGLAILGLSNKELLIVNISSNKRIRFCFLLLGFFFFINKYDSKIENSFQWYFHHFLLPIHLWGCCIYSAAQFTMLLILRPATISTCWIHSAVVFPHHHFWYHHCHIKADRAEKCWQKQSNGHFAFLRSPHVSYESLSSRFFGGWLLDVFVLAVSVCIWLVLTLLTVLIF